MVCNKNHDNRDNKIKELPLGQEDVVRHKCASIAYEIDYSLCYFNGILDTYND